MRPALVLLAIAMAACSTREPRDMTAMTFNIRYDNPGDGVYAWPNRADWVAETIRAEAPDVVGLQEALRHQVDALAGALPEYDWVGVGRDDGRDAGEFSPLFFRRDRLELINWSTLWLSETPADTGSVGWDAALPRVATRAWLRHPSGDTIRVTNVHFDHIGRVARNRSVRLLTRSQEAPEVLMGDFNVTDSTEAYAALIRSGLADAYIESGAPGLVPTFTGFEVGAPPGGRIDYIFGRGVELSGYRALDVQRDGGYVSDHRPVVASVRW